MAKQETRKGMNYRGRPIEELTKEELMEALYQAVKMYEARGRTMELISKGRR